MPKLNIYEQQYKASTPRATGESFGAAQGRAQEGFGRQVEKTGNVLTDLAIRSQNRLDGINTARAYQEYKATMDQEFLTAQQSEDFSDPKVLQAFNARAQELASETTGKFEGSMDARAKLTQMLEQERGGYSRTAYGTHVQEGYRVVGKFAQSQVDTLANRAKGSPEMLSGHLADWANEFEVLRDALPPEMEGKFYDAGVSQITQSVFGSYMDTGHFEEALATLEQPGVMEAMGGEMYNKLRMDARSLQYDNNKEARAMQTKIDLYRQFTGQEPSTPQVASALGMTINAPEKTPGQKIREISSQLGITQESNPAQYARVVEGVYGLDLGLSGGDRTYGNFQGSLAYQDLQTTFGLHEQGVATPQDKRRFVESALLFEISGDKDPVTGERRPKPLPMHFQRMKEQFASDLGIPLEPNGTVTPTNPNVTDPVSVELGLDRDPATDFTVAQISTLLTGPRAKAEGALQGFFATESLVSGEAERQYGQWLQGFGNNLRASLRQNPRVTEGELERLEKEFKLDGTVLKGAEGFMSDLAGLDIYLTEKIEQAVGFASNPGATTEMKKWAADTLPVLIKSKDKLGVVRVNSLGDVASAYEQGRIVDGQLIVRGKGKDISIQKFNESLFKQILERQGGGASDAK